jgi:hypothetical protein
VDAFIDINHHLIEMEKRIVALEDELRSKK